MVASEKWEQIALLPEGQLAEVPYPVLLLALSRVGRSGVLELHRKPVEKRIFFAEGVPVDCRSNLVHETFGRFLVGAGKLSEEDFRTALNDSLAREVPLGEVLLERGALDAGELYKLLQQCLARKLLDGFTWREGTFKLSGEAAEVDSTLRVKVPQLILTGVLKLTPLDEVTRGIRPYFTEAVARHAAPAVAEEELQLRGPAAEVLAAVHEKPLRMDELATRLPQLPANDLGRVVYALSLLELVVPASKVAARPAARPVAPPASAQPASAAAERDEVMMTRPISRPTGAAAQLSAGELDKARNRILSAFLSYRRKDAFDLLGVQENATTEGVEEGWLRFAQLFAPWPLELQAPPDLVEKARALFLAGSEAYVELRDGESRARLAHNRQAARAQRANQPRATGIQTDLLDPEAQFEKGMEMLAQGHDRKALEFLQYAADLDAQNAVYRAEAAWCRFRVLGARDQSLQDLDEAVRADPRCGLAWYYMGMIQGQSGRAAEGEESLRKAIKLMAPDRRPIDALKELTTKKR
ncbi:MAG TPA: DUF4388 domain-containing protein [Thermoanaerobaculia bacterium]|nr:DUF4388 domain-containing protein [Thermoanaerobaculia bacterium]